MTELKWDCYLGLQTERHLVHRMGTQTATHWDSSSAVTTVHLSVVERALSSEMMTERKRELKRVRHLVH